MEKHGSQWTDFHEIWYLSNFQKPVKKVQIYMISGSCHEVAENCALQGHYTASGVNFLPTFWDNQSSGAKNAKDSLLYQC